jgi:hypothetical protein
MKLQLKVTRFIILLLILIVIITFASMATASAIDIKCMNLESPNDDYLDSLKKYNRVYTYKNNDSFENFEVEYKGKIVVTNDDKDILSISPGGFFTITKSSFGNKRKIYISADNNGRLTKEYFEGKSNKDFNKDGKEWLSDILPDLVLQTGISAEERIERLARKSFLAVLNELEKLDNIKFYNSSKVNFGIYHSKTEYSRNVFYLYLKIIADKHQMTKNELYNFLKYVKKVDSQSTKGNLLRDILGKYTLSEDLMNVFLITTGSLEYNTERGATLRAFMKKYKVADYNSEQFFNVIDGMNVRSEKSNVLKPLLRAQKMDKPTMLRFIRSTGRLTQEGEKGAILYELLPMLNNDEDYTRAVISVINNMNNSYVNFKEDLMMKLANAEQEITLKKDKTILIGLLKNARGYSTNTKKFILMRKINFVFLEDKDFLYEYFNVINSMDNEFLRYNLLLHLLNNNEISSVTAIPLFNAVSRLSGEGFSHASGAILREYIKQWPKERMTRESFFETLEDIEFNCTLQEVLLELLDKRDLYQGDLFNILKSVKKLETDVTKTAVLLKAKARISNSDSEAKYIFNNVTEGLELEYEFNKVVDR